MRILEVYPLRDVKRVCVTVTQSRVTIKFNTCPQGTTLDDWYAFAKYLDEQVEIAISLRGRVHYGHLLLRTNNGTVVYNIEHDVLKNVQEDTML